MTARIRRAEPQDLGALVALDYRNFGVAAKPIDRLDVKELLDLDRFLVAVDGDDLVAAGGSFQMELTVPGGDGLAMSGVTWVSVMASHRRQGILRGLMAGLDELAVEYEEPVLGLTASEGPIYERFGYGIATRNRVTEIDRRRATIDPRLEPEPVRLVDAAEHVEEMMACFDRYRKTQVGEVSRTEALFRAENIAKNKVNFAAMHPDGYAIWAIEEAWNHGHPAHILTVKDLIAVTPAAYLALWNVVLSVDLVGPVRSIRTVAVDDPLPYLLTDQRALRTVESNDYLWLKVADPVRCFEARSYRGDDRLVVGVVEDPMITAADQPDPTEIVAIGSDGCEPTDERVEIVATRSALGPLLLGVDASKLAAGLRLRAEPGVLTRADVLLGTGLTAHCRTPF